MYHLLESRGYKGPNKRITNICIIFSLSIYLFIYFCTAHLFLTIDFLFKTQINKQNYAEFLPSPQKKNLNTAEHRHSASGTTTYIFPKLPSSSLPSRFLYRSLVCPSSPQHLHALIHRHRLKQTWKALCQ